MSSWQTKMTIPDGVDTRVFNDMMNIVWKIALISRVPKTAEWKCFKRDIHYFFLAFW